MPVGVGAHELRHDLGTVDWCGCDLQILLDHGHVEAGEVENFHNGRIGQKRFQARRIIGRPVQLHEMGAAVTGRELHQAQAVAVRIEPERFAIDGDAGAKRHPRGQVTVMEMNFRSGHGGRAVEKTKSSGQ